MFYLIFSFTGVVVSRLLYSYIVEVKRNDNTIAIEMNTNISNEIVMMEDSPGNKDDSELNTEQDKNLIVINNLSAEHLDKKEKIEEAYNEIINQYIDAIKNNYYPEIWKGNTSLYKSKLAPYINRRLVQHSWIYKDKSRYNFREFYALKDIDNNGIPELFISASNGVGEMNYYDMYTFDGTKAVNPFDELYTDSDFGYRNYLELYPEGVLEQLITMGASHHEWVFYHLISDGYHIEPLDSIAHSATAYGNKYSRKSDYIPEKDTSHFGNITYISYEDFDQTLYKYTGKGKEKLRWNRIYENKSATIDYQAQAKIDFDENFNLVMNSYENKYFKKLGQERPEDYGSKREKIKNVYEKLIALYIDVVKNNFYQELKESNLQSYEFRLGPYISRQLMDETAKYYADYYDNCIYCVLLDIDDNGTPELIIGASNGIDGINYCDIFTVNESKLIKLFDESNYIYGEKKEVDIYGNGMFSIWTDNGKNRVKTEFYKFLSDGWHIKQIESISYEIINDNGQKVYYRDKNGEYEITYELYSLILEEYEKYSGAVGFGYKTRIAK